MAWYVCGDLGVLDKRHREAAVPDHLEALSEEDGELQTSSHW